MNAETFAAFINYQPAIFFGLRMFHIIIGIPVVFLVWTMIRDIRKQGFF